MVSKRLIDYVSRMLESGYPSESIKSRLAQSGYTSKEIKDAFDSAQNPSMHSSIGYLKIIIVLIIILTISIAFYFFYFFGKDSKELRLDVKLKTSTATPGGVISVSRELFLPSSASEVILKYELILKDTSEIIAVKEETISKDIMTAIDMNVPKNAKIGDYLIRVTAASNDEKTVRTFSLKIIKSASTFPSVSSTTVTTTTATTIKKDKQQKKEHAALEASAELSPYQKLEKIKELAKTDEKSAINQCNDFDAELFKNTCYSRVAQSSENQQYCNIIANGAIKDECLSNLAKQKKDNTLCEAISTSRIKDSCYLSFLREFNDLSVCFKIENANLRDSCESFGKAGSFS